MAVRSAARSAGTGPVEPRTRSVVAAGYFRGSVRPWKRSSRAAGPAAHGLDRAIDVQLRVGVAEYCGITDASVHLIHDILGGPRVAAVDAIVSTAGVAV
ncbi:hypothetical protein [Actinoplanes utahensis]|uniref:hypothetical protein n=1 Tax=Actinoplanes utahensis TaxID=1869 RepID=UPI0013769117|nr:hypothetical protein [Actinoplanes utahensis]GIF27054.1 hypothetical protein Aut01nite_00400 [Actinoplanes utahensis]